MNKTSLTRRDLFRRAGCGMGMLALRSLLDGENLHADSSGIDNRSVNPLAPDRPHFEGKAKSVIWLFMNGGPSQVDTWNYRPELEKRDGKKIEGFDPNTGFFTNNVGPIMKSPFTFKQYGESGAWASSLFPHMSKHVDKMAFIHSVHTESNNHSPALFMMNTGMTRMGFPCVGSWVTYGLGTVNQNLPAFVVMADPKGRGLPKGHAGNWGAGFLPSVFQGTYLRPQGDPIDNLHRPNEMKDGHQRAQLDLLKQLNTRHFKESQEDLELAARIQSFELAYRMQTAAPDAFNIDSEPELTHQLYGTRNPECMQFARQCLTARRLVERGVRYIQIYSGGMSNDLSWDGHSDIVKNHGGFAKETDQPIAGLLMDLEQRGLLDDTLIIWGGEFGRLPIIQTGGSGRDHNPHANTVWLAGGGAKGGVQYGETDEIGYKAVVDRVSINDLHATILHLLGMNHLKLTYRHNGRRFRLTDVAGDVIHEVIA